VVHVHSSFSKFAIVLTLKVNNEKIDMVIEWAHLSNTTGKASAVVH